MNVYRSNTNPDDVVFDTNPFGQDGIYFSIPLDEAIRIRDDLDAIIAEMSPEPDDDDLDWQEHTQRQINELRTALEDMQKHLIRTGRWI